MVNIVMIDFICTIMIDVIYTLMVNLICIIMIDTIYTLMINPICTLMIHNYDHLYPHQHHDRSHFHDPIYTFMIDAI